jgi:hypothetical protein
MPLNVGGGDRVIGGFAVAPPRPLYRDDGKQNPRHEISSAEPDVVIRQGGFAGALGIYRVIIEPGG